MQTEPPKAEPPKRNRRWFQFSLRSLTIGVTLLAVPCAYVGYNLNWIRERDAARKSLIGRTLFDSGMDYRNRRFLTGYPLRLAPWSLRILGETGAGIWILDIPKSDPVIEQLRRLFPEASIQGRPDAN
jgi:hypothetical protein